MFSILSEDLRRGRSFFELHESRVLSSWFPHNTYSCPLISFTIFRSSFFGRRELSYGDICKRIFSHHLLAGKARAMLGMVVLLGYFHAFRIFAPGFLKAVSGGIWVRRGGGTQPSVVLSGRNLTYFSLSFDNEGLLQTGTVVLPPFGSTGLIYEIE